MASQRVLSSFRIAAGCRQLGGGGVRERERGAETGLRRDESGGFLPALTGLCRRYRLGPRNHIT